MTRVSINNVIHSAVRRDLARFDAALRAFPAGSSARAKHLLSAWKYFFDELEHHHHSEADIVWPTLRQLGVPETLLREFDAEHDALHGALVTADKAFEAFARDPSSAAAQTTRAAVVEVARVGELHLAHEDAELELVFAKHRGSRELKAMGRKFGDRPLFTTGDFFVWLQNGASASEKASIRAEIPPPVVAIIGTLCGRRYRKLAATWST